MDVPGIFWVRELAVWPLCYAIAFRVTETWAGDGHDVHYHASTLFSSSIRLVKVYICLGLSLGLLAL